jgi:hypothetical protein
MTYSFAMTDNESLQTAALTGDALQCRTNPPRQILVLEDDAGICKLNTEVLTESGGQVKAAEESFVGWQARLASNQHRKLQSAKHRLHFGRRNGLGAGQKITL